MTLKQGHGQQNQYAEVKVSKYYLHVKFNFDDIYSIKERERERATLRFEPRQAQHWSL